MGRVLNKEAASWPGPPDRSDPIVYRVTNLPEGIDISIQKVPFEETWQIVRGGRGLPLVPEGHYASAAEALEILREEFPG